MQEFLGFFFSKRGDANTLQPGESRSAASPGKQARSFLKMKACRTRMASTPSTRVVLVAVAYGCSVDNIYHTIHLFKQSACVTGVGGFLWRGLNGWSTAMNMGSP